jgi:glutamate N-acetyltransferase/amino-acid N-acetyltransferase
MKTVEGGIVAAQGFLTAGVYSGVKRKRNDLALIVSDRPAAYAGVFTQNVVKAPCVTANQEHLRSGQAQAVIVNSGNANACNGEAGVGDNERMAMLAADALEMDRSSVLTASTGVIGVALPMEKIETSIPRLVSSLHGKHSNDTAEAILTTDTFSKQFAVELDLSGGVTARVGAIAKGSGMIAPNMATMLGFITTDVAIDQTLLQTMLTRCVWYTFNSITVDGDTSTNDMVLVLANGAAENRLIDGPESTDAAIFETALYNVCLHLAKEIARDGEGATKLVEVVVKNIAPPKNLLDAYAASGLELTREQRAAFARSVAKTVANSSLVKTALFGNDPNWGRILAAAGRSGVTFDPALVEISLAGHKVYAEGKPTDFNGYVVSEALKKKEVGLMLDFHQERGEDATVWTCDLSYDYVKINAEYHT